MEPQDLYNACGKLVGWWFISYIYIWVLKRGTCVCAELYEFFWCTCESNNSFQTRKIHFVGWNYVFIFIPKSYSHRSKSKNFLLFSSSSLTAFFLSPKSCPSCQPTTRQILLLCLPRRGFQTYTTIPLAWPESSHLSYWFKILQKKIGYVAKQSYWITLKQWSLSLQI